MQTSPSSLLALARVGLALTPDELDAIDHQITEAANVAADHAAAAAERRAAEKIAATGAATTKTVYLGVGAAGLIGGLLGGYVGYRLARR